MLSRVVREKIANATIFTTVAELIFAILLNVAFAPFNLGLYQLASRLPVVTISVWVSLGTFLTLALGTLGVGKRRIWAIAISLIALLMIFRVLADAD